MADVGPRRAKLELLVRKDDGAEPFELREIGSAVAFIRSRPQRVPGDSFELAEVASRVDGQRSFILKNKATDRFLLITEPERFLWEQMDGTRSLQEIATAYVLRYGEFDFDVIPQLMRKLQRAQLLTQQQIHIAPQKGQRGAQLVRDILHQLILEPVHLRQLFVGGLE